jgi:S-DNA-T family DNA segregation ATPase FtsK/SpoIIIE
MSEAFDIRPGSDNVRYLPSVRIPLHELTDCALCGTSPADCAALTSGPVAVACCTTCNHTTTAADRDGQDHEDDQAPRVVDGQIVDDTGRPGSGLAVRVPQLPPRVGSTARWAKRNAGYALAGSKVRRAERRARRKHTDLTEAIATLRINAKGAEDFHTLKELEEVLERRRAGASQRARENRIEVLKWSGGTIVVLASGHVILLAVGAVQAVTSTGSLTDLWLGMVDFWTTVVTCSPVGPYWWAWAVGGAGVWAARTIPVGRDRGQLPTWAVEPDTTPADPRNVIPSEAAVLTALQHLGIAKLDQAFKKGWGRSITPTWIQPPLPVGKGWHMQLVLPLGVPVEELVKRTPLLAHNLVRSAVEVWPSEPKGKPGVLDLFVADQGALSGPVDPWPWLETDEADYFGSVPVGINARGEVVKARLSEVNYAFAGSMGSGKSTMILTLLGGAMLDPLVDIDVFVMAQNADYQPMKPRLRTLRTGSERAVIQACMDTLSELYADLSVRGKALQEHDEPAVTRALAAKDERLRPRIVVMDECQALFMDKELGEAAIDLAVLLISAARKYAITLMFATPEPSSASLPRRIMAITRCKACFAIGDQQSNDAILGTGSYKAGISAVSLEPMTDEGPGDIGTAMTRGIMAKPGLLRSFFIRRGHGEDQMTPLVERAMTRYTAAGRAQQQRQAEVEPRDLVADVLDVIGDEATTAAKALAALKTAHPRHLPYQAFKDRMALVKALAEQGVKVPSTDGKYPVNPITLRQRILSRSAEDTDPTDDQSVTE